MDTWQTGARFNTDDIAWLRSRTPLRREGELPAQAETVVVGGGIAGLALASALAARGASPLLIEAHDLGTGATGRSAGMVLADGPTLVRADGAARERGDALRRAGMDTRVQLEALAQRHEFGYRRTGSLRLAASAAEAVRLLSPTDTGLAVLNADRLPPPYDDGRWVAGRIDPGDGVLDPVVLAGALASEADEHGATLRTGRRLDRIWHTPQGLRLLVGQQTVTARTIVLATNAWTSRVIPRISIAPLRAQMLAARLNPVPRWSLPVCARDGADYWRLSDDGVVLIGGCRNAGGLDEETRDGHSSESVQAALTQRLATLAPGARIEVLCRWAGIMGFTPDGAPLVGRLYDGVWVFAGFHGHGIGWAPGLAPTLAAAILNEANPIPSVFRPTRFARGR